MPVWLLENWGNIVVLGMIALAVFAIVFSHVRKRKQGKGTCGCGCGQCALRDACHGSHDPKSKK